MLRDGPGGGERQHQRAERHPVDDEHRQRVAHEVAQQPRDRRVADDEREHRGDQRRAEARAAGIADLARLEQARQHDRRDREQERVARGRLAIEPAEEARADRRARARHAGDQRQRLRDADERAVARSDLLQRAVALGRAIGDLQHQSEHDQRDADHVQVAPAALDLVAEDEAEDRDRDRAEPDVPAHARVERGAQRRVAQAEEPGAQDPPQVIAEVQEHGGHRAELDDRGERRSRVLPAAERRDDPQMRRARDRQELGQPLHDAEDDGLKRVHSRGTLVAPPRSAVLGVTVAAPGDALASDGDMSTATIESRSPQDQSEIVVTAPAADREVVAAAVERARAAQREWSRSALARADALSAAAEAVNAAKDEIVDLMVREVGKPLTEAVGEHGRSVRILRYQSQSALDPDGDTYPAAPPSDLRTLLLSRRRPRGVAGLITPWNFPFAIPLWKA